VHTLVVKKCSNPKMAGILGLMNYHRLVQRAIRRERVFRDRVNPIHRYDDVSFVERYRLSRACVMHIIGMLNDELSVATH
jgi:hypothetical protein